jgi:hydroxypyruvate reductase
MPEQVLIYSRFPKAQMARIGEHYDLLDGGGKPPVETFTLDELKNVRALITAGGQVLPKAVTDTLPSLGAIICYGTGYDGVDFAEATRRKIVVGNSPGANADAVAEMALMLMLAANRQMVVGDHHVRSGNWANAKPSPLTALRPGIAGRKIGVYGLGEIGRKIAARCDAFETEVGYFSRTKYDVPYRYFPSLDALAEWSDILMIAVRAGPDTQHIVNADILKKLGPQGSIVNITRGSVIDEKALLHALENGVISSAGLDVYEKEPHAPDALTKLPNIVLMPHVGGHTMEGHREMQNCVIANLGAFFSGQPLPYPVA